MSMTGLCALNGPEGYWGIGKELVWRSLWQLTDIWDMGIAKKGKAEIESIISEMDCPRGYSCYKSGFENLCHVRFLSGDKIIECLDAESDGCRYSEEIGFGTICKCPLRLYIACHHRL